MCWILRTVLSKGMPTLKRRVVLCMSLVLLLLIMTNLPGETLDVMRRSGAFKMLGGNSSVPTGAFKMPGRNSSVPTGAFKMPGRNSSVPTGAFKMPGRNSSVPGAQAKDEPLPPCPEKPPGLLGKMSGREVEKPLPELEKELGQLVRPGGDYSPPDCLPKDRTAIIIPNRNRWRHFRVLIKILIPFLIRQQLSFTIFVVEQDQSGTFNKGHLLNIAVLEALKRDNYTCFVFHDVDLLPTHDFNLYRCSSSPLHLSVAIDKFSFQRPGYVTVGGVLALSREHLGKVNGYSNLYIGWGAEDDDMNHRLSAMHMKVKRNPASLAVFHMIKHDRDKGNKINAARLTLYAYKNVVERMATDGLNTTRYTRTGLDITPIFTWLKININITDVLQNSPAYVQEAYKKHGIAV